MTGYAQSSSEHVFGALRGPADVVDREARRRRVETTIGAGVLIAILAGCLLVVVAAADRPSFLAATTTGHYFPHWMAGPLGGLWPSLTRSTTGLRWLFTAPIVLMFASYLVGLRYVPLLRARWVIAAIVGAHAIMFLSPPLALTDIFNYINYGRMEVVHNLNPYTTIPVLEPHNDPSYAPSNWHQLLSPYGPLFTLITFVVVPLGVAMSFWLLKGLLMLTSLGIVFLVWRSARLVGRDPVAAIVFVGLNPVVLIWGLGGDHNDFLMMFCAVLGFYLLLRAGSMPGAVGRGSAVRSLAGSEGIEAGDASAVGEPGGVAAQSRAITEGPRTDAAANGSAGRQDGSGAKTAEVALWSPVLLGAGAAFVAAVAIKASAGILLPVVLAALLHRRRDLLQVVAGMALGAVVFGLASVIAFGPHFPDLATQGRLVTMTSIPNLFGLALGAGGETTTMRVLLSGVLVVAVAACSLLAYRRRESLTAAGWASIALLVTLSWVLPWYVLWILPLAALSSSRRLRVAAVLMGVYMILAWAPLGANVFNAIGFHPEKTALGRLHQRYVKELLY
jgi:alpha-1,6-mannosyltransferase